MKILITGIAGFVGSHLADYCLSKARTRISGTILPHASKDELKRVKGIKDKIEILECDLTDKIKVERVLKKVKPDKIFHLAAQSSPSFSWSSPKETLFNNIVAELNIFEVVRKLKLNPVIQIAGSADEYGLVYKSELPIKETNPFRPLSPYGVSKVTQEMLASQYFRSYGLKTVTTRAFNHEGPGKGKHFAVSAFSIQIAAIEKGKQKPIIKVGNLSARRDLTDVRDVVRAYWLATERCKFGEAYNIGSGRAYKIEEVLKILLSFSKTKIKVVKDPKLIRPNDVEIWQCDYDKFKKATGWNPKIDLKNTLLDTLNYWRKEI